MALDILVAAIILRSRWVAWVIGRTLGGACEAIDLLLKFILGIILLLVHSHIWLRSGFWNYTIQILIRVVQLWWLHLRCRCGFRAVAGGFELFCNVIFGLSVLRLELLAKFDNCEAIICSDWLLASFFWVVGFIYQLFIYFADVFGHICWISRLFVHLLNCLVSCSIERQFSGLLRTYSCQPHEFHLGFALAAIGTNWREHLIVVIFTNMVTFDFGQIQLKVDLILLLFFFLPIH